MKHKICIAVDADTLLAIREKVGEGKFRNRSHAFEYAVREVILCR